MNQLTEDSTILRRQEFRLRRKLFAEKGKDVKRNERSAIIRQAQKWKLEAILQKKRAQDLAFKINEQRVKLWEERQFRKHAQAANNIMKQRVYELRNVQKANKRIIEQARKWKETANLAELKRYHEEKTPQVIREKERMAERIIDLERKLMAAQRKLSLKKSNGQKLINAKEEALERKMITELQLHLLKNMENNMRLDLTVARDIMITAQRNLERYKTTAVEKEEQRFWIKRMKRETEKLKKSVKEIIDRGVELKRQNNEKADKIKELQKENLELENKVNDHEEKMKEKEEELRYVEYLHDELYQSALTARVSNLSPSSAIQSISINPNNYKHVECEVDLTLLNTDN